MFGSKENKILPKDKIEPQVNIILLFSGILTWVVFGSEKINTCTT